MSPFQISMYWSEVKCRVSVFCLTALAVTYISNFVFVFKENVDLLNGGNDLVTDNRKFRGSLEKLDAPRSPRLDEIRVRLFEDHPNQNKPRWSKEAPASKKDWIMPIFKKDVEDLDQPNFSPWKDHSKKPTGKSLSHRTSEVVCWLSEIQRLHCRATTLEEMCRGTMFTSPLSTLECEIQFC